MGEQRCDLMSGLIIGKNVLMLAFDFLPFGKVIYKIVPVYQQA